MEPINGACHRVRTAGLGLALFLLVPNIALVTVGGIPTSVLSSAKETSVQHHSSELNPIHQSQQSNSIATSDSPEGKHQISVPQKRGVNPLLYNDFEFSGNSMPHGGSWDDLGSSPSLAGRSSLALFPDQLGGSESHGGRLRNYDLLANLLSAPSQTFYNEPISVPSVSYPFGYYGMDGRTKRMANLEESNRQRPLRLKRSPSKLTSADALSLLALLESRDPYPSMSDYFPLVPADGPNDVLPYSPNSVYQDIPLYLELPQLNRHAAANVGPLAPYSDDDGEWMNTWTEPAGFPLDIDTLPPLDPYDLKLAKNGFPQQKRFMIAKRKRSVSLNDNEDCNSDKEACMQRKYGQLTPSKVAQA
ncbi:uncharacterized protein LOC129776014 [Toxorhynchites rutilus septentrionalis]|uniref:uncharacterized protein LOC129776014 n=1 Tax=Toxorhynchites rutilus septentrionalis TaxID=329112 RepID=UPI0024794B75|nr:uncharacterized protein LOC129776014 [Toxorhynchites rutilus septentrionalis]